MSQRFSLNVNGKKHDVDVDPDLPLLYALRNDVGLNNPHHWCIKIYEWSSESGMATQWLSMSASKTRRLEESEVSEQPVATTERSALGYAPTRFSAVIVAATLMLSLDLSFGQDTSFGQRLFQDKADCQFCHGIDGDGRGDPRSPGRVANLHETHLSRDQLVEVIACGRPGTEMPHFDKYAYEDTDCYGLKGKTLGNDAARDPHSTSLTKREIEAVTDYILAKFVGK
jgi:cytochrome c553